jgi:hypothetical protein
VSQQTRSGEPFGDRTFRGRSLVDSPAGAAAIAGSADADDAKPCRHVIEHLADRLADQVQFATTAGAGLVLEIEPPVLAR